MKGEEQLTPMTRFIALVVGALPLFLTACATIKNTPQQDYTSTLCDMCRTSLPSQCQVTKVDTAGRYYVTCGSGSQAMFLDFQKCVAEQEQLQPYGKWLAAHQKAAPPAPAPTTAARVEPSSVDAMITSLDAMVKTPEPRPTTPETPSSESNQDASPASPPVASRLPPSMRRQPGGGGGLGGGRGGVEGEPTPLGTSEPKYRDYFNKVRERIKAKWVYPRPAGERGIEGELLIEFHIAKDGSLEFIELRRSSGTALLDEAALNAVEQAQPFPPVPDSVAKQSLAINGAFRYHITRGSESTFSGSPSFSSGQAPASR
jgi:TonB family protein